VITNALQGITEDDIAEYLVNTPGFFERHASKGWRRRSSR
jgi:hypothetical protein